MTPQASLDALRAELLPIVTAAMRTIPGPCWASVRVSLSPLALTVALHTCGDGLVGTVYGQTTPALAEAVTGIVSGCFSALPAERARKVGAYLAREPGALSLVMDGEIGRVHVLLDPGGDADLFELGSLSDERVH